VEVSRIGSKRAKGPKRPKGSKRSMGPKRPKGSKGPRVPKGPKGAQIRIFNYLYINFILNLGVHCVN